MAWVWSCQRSHTQWLNTNLTPSSSCRLDRNNNHKMKNVTWTTVCQTTENVNFGSYFQRCWHYEVEDGVYLSSTRTHFFVIVWKVLHSEWRPRPYEILLVVLCAAHEGFERKERYGRCNTSRWKTACSLLRFSLWSCRATKALCLAPGGWPVWIGQQHWTFIVYRLLLYLKKQHTKTSRDHVKSASHVVEF